jgi:phosphotransferase system HPr (HPr) family protein
MEKDFAGQPRQAGKSSVTFPPKRSQEVMNGATLRRKVKITNPSGLHMRPLTAFVQRARQFESSVTVTKDAQSVNGKSPLELMLLAAEEGTELVLEVSGSDAESAIDVLAELLAAPKPEDPPDEPLPKKG